MNPAWTAVVGVPNNTATGKKFGEPLPDGQTHDDILIEVLADGQPREASLSSTTRTTSP